ncbi:hypothetical protein UFOVP730_8 [uncultured Caudovirales phage]|uniref:Portal protein n=1 Tax=uncultured Caudovirales phage TaxID=2100421 RepID=A0A6J5NLL3_9CAUD|nr:hypothetical protein UFOVP730_8 [uncultured Caudovirales phage]
MSKMTDDELVVAVERLLHTSNSFAETKLSSERREVMQYYRGELPRPTHAGNSKYVSMDVYDSVDSMRAQLLEAFSAHQRIVQFAPQGPDDVAKADEATNYCSYSFYRRNPGPKIAYDILTDALTGRYGVAKVWVEDEAGKEERFDALTEDELAVLISEGLEPDSVEQEGQLYSGKGRRKGYRCIKVGAVPLEEILVSPGAPSIEQADVIHQKQVTKGWLLKQGYPEGIVEDLPGSSSPTDMDWEKDERFKPFTSISRAANDVNPHRVMVDYYECYVDLDYEGDGIEELYRIVMAGRTILEVEKVKRKPFAFFVPLPTPHTPFGENFGKFIIPTQNARSVLIRGILDHTIITNNPRMLVLNGTLVNPTELQDNRLGGLVNVRRMDGLAPIPQSQLNPFVFQTIQLLDDDKEETTGISKLSQGLNKDAISKQNSQGMVEGLINASMTRQKIVARQFGEFMKNLFLLIYDTALEHMDEQEFVEVNGAWTPVDPRLWEERKEVTVDLSLSPSEAVQEAQKFTLIDQYLSADPRLADQYGPAQRYQIQKRMLQKMGIVDVEAVLLPPEKVEPKEPDPAAVLQLQMLQAQVAELQARTQAQQIKNALDARKIDGKINVDMAKLELDTIKTMHDMDMDKQEMQMARAVPDKSAVIAPDS